MEARHLCDEDLLLDYYGEATPEQRTEMRGHLETCAACRSLDRELRAVLALVDNEPVPEPPAGFEREMWARLEPHITERTNGGSGLSWTSEIRPRPDTPWRFELPRWALAAAAVALAAGSFALGRAWNPVPPTAGVASGTSASNADVRSMAERLLRSEVEDHLERSQRVLVELVNADDPVPVMLAGGRERAADLVAAGRLYRRSVEAMGDAETRDLLEDIERVLVEIANGPDVGASNDLSDVRARIGEQDLIFRLRLTTAEMRARERRALATW